MLSEEKKRISSRGMYIRSIADIPPTSDIPPNWGDMRNIADIPKLGEMPREV
jgi:hypothetical protein